MGGFQFLILIGGGASGPKSIHKLLIKRVIYQNFMSVNSKDFMKERNMKWGKLIQQLQNSTKLKGIATFRSLLGKKPK